MYNRLGILQVCTMREKGKGVENLDAFSIQNIQKTFLHRLARIMKYIFFK